MPLLLKVEVDDRGTSTTEDDILINEAPTVGDLLSVPVDANGDGEVNKLFFDTSDDDEVALQNLDANDDGVVDAGEFLTAWFFDRVTEYLDTQIDGDGALGGVERKGAG